jgi:tRNA pseudouridine55 synthase
VFSAKRVAGVRAYAAARRGEPMQLEPVAVTVHKWQVLGREGPDLEVEIHCNGGTYVRALARDLGEATGSAAHLTALRRLRSGRYEVSAGITLDALERGEFDLLAPTTAVAHMPRQALDDLEAKRVMHGQNIGAMTTGELAALYHDEELIAVAVREGESWRPKVVLRDA